MNYYVLITQFQQLLSHAQFVPSVPHIFPSLDYFEENHKQHIISPINILLGISKKIYMVYFLKQPQNH